MPMDVTMLPTMLFCLSTFYSPFALGLYIYHRDHPNIRYRQPKVMSIVGVCLASCSIIYPFLPSSGGRCVLWLVWLSLICCALITYSLVQISLVLTFKITEILAHPELAIRETTTRLSRYRWYFRSSVQKISLVFWNLVFVTPLFYPFDLHNIATEYQDTSADLTTWSIILGEFGIIGAVQVFLAYHVSHVVDNFGLRRAIMASANAAVVASILGFAFLWGTSKFEWNWVTTYRLKGCLASFPIHIIFYNHFIVPLRPVIMPKVFDQKIVVLPSKHHTRRDSVALATFNSFLKHPDGFRALTEFCTLELCLERLLAWKCMDDFQSAPSYRNAMEVYNQCITPFCKYSTLQGAYWCQHYKERVHNWIDDEVKSSAFDDIKQEVLESMFKEIFPRFLSDGKYCDLWKQFLDRKRVVEKLNRVMTMSSRQITSIQHPRPPASITRQN